MVTNSRTLIIRALHGPSILFLLFLLFTAHTLQAQSVQRLSGDDCIGSVNIFQFSGPCSIVSWTIGGGGTLIQSDNTSIYVKWDSPTTTAYVEANYSGCSSILPGMANSQNYNIKSKVVPSVTLTTDSNVCQGNSVTLFATTTNCGESPSYSWYVDNTLVGTGSSNRYNYPTGSLTAGNHSAYVVVGVSASCVTASTATSTTQSFSVTGKSLYSVNVVGPDLICSGNNSVTFVASVSGGVGTLMYQWYKNGSLIGGEISTTFTTSVLENNTIYCVVSSDFWCTNSPITSNTYLVHLTPSVDPTPSVNIEVAKTGYCAGETITFTVNSGYIAGSSTYKWYLNSALYATTRSVSLITSSNPSATNAFKQGDIVSVDVFNLVGTCLTTNTVSVSKSGIEVYPLPQATISPTGPIKIKSNASLSLSVPVVTGYKYQWKLDGMPIPGPQGNTNPYSTNVPGKYEVVVTSINNCVLESPNSVLLSVNKLPTVYAGEDKKLTLPSNTVSLNGSASDSDGIITGYNWMKISGPNATMSGENTTGLLLSSLNIGNYIFRLSVKDDTDESVYDDVSVTVLPPPNNYNFIKESVVTIGGVTSEAMINSLEIGKKVELYTYFDGLGRPMQTVSTKISPGNKDFVAPIVYDNYGRENLKYLPFTSPQTNGFYKPISYQGNLDYSHDFYDNLASGVASDNRPFSEIIYEPSPLNRLQKEYGAGEAWSPVTNNKFISHKFSTNIYDINNVNHEKIIAWKIDVGGLPVKLDPLSGTIELGGYYSTGQLFIKSIKDEQGNEVREYTDKQGIVVLKKTQAVPGASLSNDNHWAQTYYIYDDIGNLRFVLQPKLLEALVGNPTQVDLDNFAFQYKYDLRQRMTHKKVPGARITYMVYDNRDRIVLTQDGNQRTTSPYFWTFTKYDELNRPILTGIKDTAALLTQAEMQTVVNYHYTKMGAPWGEKYGASEPIHGYSNNTYPIYTSAAIVDPNHYLTVTYYDNYLFRDQWIDSYTYTNEALSQTINGVLYQQPNIESLRIIGQVTGSKVKVLDGGTRGRYTWLKTVSYYDDKYRQIQSIADNYKGGQDKTTNLYDFTGKVLKTMVRHTTNEISWTGLVNTVVVGNNLLKTALGNGWTAGGVTVQQLPSGIDGWIECVISEPGQRRAFGLTAINEGENVNTIDYAFWHDATTAKIFENGGTAKYTLTGPVKSGDVIRIARTGTTIKYYKNGVLLYTSLTASSTPLIGDACIDSGSGNILVPRASFMSKADVVMRRFVYDHAGRLSEVWHQVNAAPEVRITYNQYNEIGQLIDKKLHSTALSGSNAVQSIDYRYNIRGWLTDMNENNLSKGDAGDPKDYFSFQLAYNNDIGIGNTLLYNGNISGMKWSTNLGLSEKKMNAFNYSYDNMNRITAAAFKTGTGTPELLTWATPTGNSFSESGYSYDLNGNILGLTRKGKNGSNLDILTYDYGTGSTQTNQLLNVSDIGSKTEGFTEIVAEGNDYKYDNNGNLVWDKNKGGKEILANGEFTTGSTGWIITDTGARLTFQDDSLKVIPHATASATIRQDDIILKKATYVVIVDMVRVAGSISFNIGFGGNKSVSTSGKTIFTYTAGSGNDFIVTIPTTFSGRINSIEVKGIVVMSYNYLNLPEKISKGLQQSLGYIYDATGRKISQEVYNSAGLVTKKSDYEGEFFYENDTLRFISHDEGRAVISGSLPEYQYHLKDHLGNVRMTFTTKPESEAFTATLETGTQAQETNAFKNYHRVDWDLFDHTDAAGTVYTFSQLLHAGNNSQVGLAKSFSVMPGDTIKAEVFAKYQNLTSNTSGLSAFATALTSAFGLNSTMAGDPGLAYDALDSYGTLIAGGYNHSDDINAPKAFLNILLFDKDYNFVDAAYKQIGNGDIQTGTVKAPHGLLFKDKIVTQAGYAFVFLSNENPTQVDVYFDDLKITHSKSPVIQMDDYYPFGLTFNSYQRENSFDQNYLFNGKEKQDELDLGWLDYGWRMYQPEIARWNAVDQYASVYEEYSPYSFGANNPVVATDYEGKLIIYVNGFRPGDYGIYVARQSRSDARIPAPHDHKENWFYTDTFKYWGDFNKSWSFPDSEEKRFYVDGSNHPNSSADDRFSKGETEGKILADKIKSGEIKLEDGETIKLIGHSMGAAHAMGMARGLLDAGIDPNLIQVLLFAPHQPNQIESVDGIFLLQAYRDGDKVSGKGALAAATNSKNKRIGNNSEYARMLDGNDDGRGNHGVHTYTAEEFKSEQPNLYQYLIDKKIINPDGTLHD